MIFDKGNFHLDLWCSYFPEIGSFKIFWNFLHFSSSPHNFFGVCCQPYRIFFNQTDWLLSKRIASSENNSQYKHTKIPGDVNNSLDPQQHYNKSKTEEACLRKECLKYIQVCMVYEHTSTYLDWLLMRS